MGLYLVIGPSTGRGNGADMYGPFDTLDEAIQWGHTHCKSFQVSGLYDPATVKPHKDHQPRKKEAA